MKKMTRKQRFRVIDTLRGMSLFYMVLLHLSQFALVPEDRWFWAALYTFVDTIGVPAFLFTSGFALAISCSRKFQKGFCQDIPYEIIYKKARNDTWFRGIFLLFIGVIYNLGFAVIQGDMAMTWSWQILQLIGIAQILTFYTRKMRNSTRIVLMFLVVILSEPLAYIFYENPDPILGTIGHILYNPINLNPPLPFLFYSFLGAFVGDIMMRNRKNIVKNKGVEFRRSMIIYGSIFLFLGVVLGYQLTTDSWIFRIITNEFNIAGLPVFLLRGSIPNVFYNSGLLLFLTISINKIFLLKRSTEREREYFSMLGKASLSLYLYHHLAFFLIERTWDIRTIWLAALLFIGAFSIIFFVWYKKGKYKYGVEWAIEELRRLFYSRFFTYEREMEKIKARMKDYQDDDEEDQEIETVILESEKDIYSENEI